MAGLISSRNHTKSPALNVVQFHSKAEHDRYITEHAADRDEHYKALCDLYTDAVPFKVDGWCYVCGRPSAFHVEFSLGREMNGRMTPAWRESVVCGRCLLNNRQRASVHLVETEGHLKAADDLYITEQTSNLYKAVARRHKRTTGSEFLGDSVPLGNTNAAGIRNEDLTRLTFPSEHFAAVMCFDVLEHVPNYRAALSELSRVLKSGGSLVMSAPFAPHLQQHLVRARMSDDGSVTHLEEPEYHSDPLDPKGCLCFYHFGFAMLDDLKASGFRDACVAYYPSREYSYLGLDAMMFIAVKA